MKKRLRTFQIFVVLLAAALGLRLADLQILRREEFIQAADENRIRIRPVRALRGRIFDARGVLLASNRLSQDLIFVAAKAPAGTIDVTAHRLSVLLDEDSAGLKTKMVSAKKLPLWPVVLARDLPDSLLYRVAWYGPFLPGIEIQPGPARTYPQDTVAAHALGYLGEISDPELDVMRDSGYQLGDWLGKSGIERKYDLALRGVDGLEQFEADPLGQPLRLLSEKPFVPGNDFELTLDADLCRWAAEAMEGKEGAVVGIEPATGRVRCLVSTPHYDPAIFVDRNRMKDRAAILTDAKKPLLSRVWNGRYPPGSTYKIVGVIAGLRSGKISPSTRFTCGGSYRGKGCWKRSGHGTLNLIGGLANSCDVYFYLLSEVVGVYPLAETARALGTDALPGLGLGTEQAGIVPTPEWEKANVRGEAWTLGDVWNTVIGQGYVLSTPIQVARMTAAAVIGGRRMKLGIVERVRDPHGEVIFEFEPQVEEDMKLDADHARIVRQALLAVVEGGTAARIRLTGMRMGGKTGTSENPHGEDHGWITMVAPLSESGDEIPKLVLTVLYVHGKSGSGGAGPIAKYVLERWAAREGYIAPLPAPDTGVVS